MTTLVTWNTSDVVLFQAMLGRWAAALLLVAMLAGGVAGAKRSRDKESTRDQRRKSVGGAPPGEQPPGPVALNPPRSHMNVCDSFHYRSLNVYCHCSALQVRNATEASCWVFGKGENETAPIWDSFSSQVRICLSTVSLKLLSC